MPARISVRDMKPTSPPAEVQHKYNVYATPFVTSQLRQINKLPGQIIETASRHFINYPAYVSSFAGYDFLPPRALYSTPTRNLTVSPHGPRANNYLDYLATVWQTEIAAKEAENEGFALYKVELQRFFPGLNNLKNKHAPEHDLFTLIIPGLREDSPHVELGDTLEIRQLVVDHNNNLISQQNGHPQQPWTGIIYHASIHGVYRAEEIVYLKADGLQELFGSATWPNGPLPVAVNVVFPLKKRSIHACRDALVFIDDALSKTIDAERRILKQSGDVDQQQQLVKEVTDLVRVDQKPANGTTKTNGIVVGPKSNDWIRRMLFPVESDGCVQTQLRKIPQRPLFDSQVNYEQAHVVNSVCVNDYGCLPYLISGPPGTGKTKTIVETAMQLLNSHATDHILICAPSESAADTLALRLKEYLNMTQLLRLNGPWRADNEVPSSLTPYTYMEADLFALPPFKQLMAYNVVVTSCRDAAILVEARLTNTDLWTLEKNMLEAFHPESAKPPSNLHWGALLLDEAAQGTELDVLSALSTVCPPPSYPSSSPQPRFVLAGDEKQLGPKIVSHDPQFSCSLFARLFARPLYKNHPLSRTNTKPSTGPPVLRRSMLPILYPPFTNLIRNYRSHPAILSIPSALFYSDTLLPEAPTPHNPLQSSHLWHGLKWPVLFVPHCHTEDIERDGGGWYNPGEAHLACSLAAHLVRYDAVAQSDICIISPFAAQVKRIRAVMRSAAFALWDVNIGPLEAFQGLEKRVVIVATTRTRGGWFVEEDRRRGLGLIHQPRKMNVALTRAKEGLVVLGNPEVLMEDAHWRSWLAFCGRNGLVKDDGSEWWEKEREEFEGAEGARIGVLEKALLARKNRKLYGDAGRTLGGKAARAGNGFDGDYEEWVESLREAMDEEDFEDEDEHDGVEDEEHHDAEDEGNVEAEENG